MIVALLMILGTMYTAMHWFGVPVMEAGLLGLCFWPITAASWWHFGVALYIFFVLAFGSPFYLVGG